MKASLLKMTTVLLVFLSACKKQDPANEPQLTQQPGAGKAKAWYEEQLRMAKRPVSATGSFTAQLMPGQDKPVWDKAAYYAAERTTIVPLESATKPQPGKVKASGYLVVEQNAAGGIAKGNIYYLIQDRDATKLRVDPSLFRNSIEKENFSGAILRFSPSGYKAESWYYKDGAPQERNDRLLQRVQKGNSGAQSIAPLDEGCSWVTIDWYWQTFENGVLVFEEYLFSTTSVVCETEGGGGGGSQNVDLYFRAGVEAGHAVSEKISEETFDIDPSHRRKKYYWRIYKNSGIGGTVQFFSEEVGYQQKLANGKWIFTGLDHVSITRIGGGLNWNVTCELISANSVIATGQLANWASMYLDYKVHYRFAALGYENEDDDRKTSAAAWSTSQGEIIPFPEGKN